jgi:hypothetical protein
VEHWVRKREMLAVALEEMERHSAECTEARKNARPYALNPIISVSDENPRLRLGLAVESICSCVYATTEIAANFANRLTAKGNPEGQLPAGFTDIKAKLSSFPRLAIALGSLDWHDHLHAMRTEWAHFSTIFVGEGPDGEPLVCGEDLRRDSDKRVLKERFHKTLAEVRDLANQSVRSLDGFALYMVPLAIAKLDIDAVCTVPLYDQNGFPRFTAEGKLEGVETLTIRALLERDGWGEFFQSAPSPPST